MLASIWPYSSGKCTHVSHPQVLGFSCNKNKMQDQRAYHHILLLVVCNGHAHAVHRTNGCGGSQSATVQKRCDPLLVHFSNPSSLPPPSTCTCMCKHFLYTIIIFVALQCGPVDILPNIHRNRLDSIHLVDIV